MYSAIELKLMILKKKKKWTRESFKVTEEVLQSAERLSESNCNNAGVAKKKPNKNINAFNSFCR